jgi:hypothetical protein
MTLFEQELSLQQPEKIPEALAKVSFIWFLNPPPIILVSPKTLLQNPPPTNPLYPHIELQRPLPIKEYGDSTPLLTDPIMLLDPPEMTL